MDRRKLLSFGLLAVLPGLAHAQGHGNHGPGGQGPGGQGPGGQGPGGQRPGQGSGPGSGGGRPPGQGSGQGPGHGPGHPGGGGSQPGRPGGGGSPSRPPATRPPSSQRPPSRPRPTPPMGPHRPGAGRPPGFRPVQGGRWRYPPGQRYRRWAIGGILPGLFLSSGYIYDDYWRLGLGGPPYGYHWVRYGPDLLLVEWRTGRVVDVIYGAFY